MESPVFNLQYYAPRPRNHVCDSTRQGANPTICQMSNAIASVEYKVRMHPRIVDQGFFTPAGEL